MDEIYALTPLGTIGREACDALILQMVKTGRNGIVLKDGQLHFIDISPVWDDGK